MTGTTMKVAGKGTQAGKEPVVPAPVMIALGLVGAVLTVFMQAVPVVDQFKARPLQSLAIALGLLDVALPAVYAVLRARRSAAARSMLWLSFGAGALTVAMCVGGVLSRELERSSATAFTPPSPAALQRILASASPSGAPITEKVNWPSGVFVSDDTGSAHEVGIIANDSDVTVVCQYEDTRVASIQGGYRYLIGAGPWKGYWSPAYRYWNGGSTVIVDPAVPACPSHT